MSKSVYVNLDDDVAKIVAKVKREKTPGVVLVIPKRSFVFSDSINLRLLKKQLDVLGKSASILTMDTKGQMYAKEAGFDIKFLAKSGPSHSFSDIRQNGGPRKPSPKKAVLELESISPETRTWAKKVSAPTVAAPVTSTVPKKTQVSKRISVPKKIAATENVYLPPNSRALNVPTRRSYRKWVIGFISISLIVVLLLVLVVLPSATVMVYAKSQIVARDMDIIADIRAEAIDANKLIIPAFPVNESQTVSDNFQTMGKKEVGSKAEGRVAIYNLTGSPINLKAATTTLNVGSKTYLFKSDQSGIRALNSASEDSNASVADIIANAGGEDFNLPSGTRMEITNQAFGSQPQRLYAKTVTQAVGGSSRFISVITKDDITKAQESLTKKVTDSINEKLKADNQILIKDAYTKNVSTFTTDLPEGTEAPTFNAQEQISINGLAVNENKLKDMVRQRFILSLGTSKNLQDVGQDTVAYKVKNIDAANGLMQLSLHYESKAIPALETNALQAQIAGKTKSEAAELILSNPDIDRVEIFLAPTWQSSLPRFDSKIHFQIK